MRKSYEAFSVHFHQMLAKFMAEKKDGSYDKFLADVPKPLPPPVASVNKGPIIPSQHDLKSYRVTDHLSSLDPEVFADVVLTDINNAAANLYTLWQAYLSMLIINPKISLYPLYQTYLRKIKERFFESRRHSSEMSKMFTV